MLSLHYINILQGVIWIAIATAAELPQAVSLARLYIVFIDFLTYSIIILHRRCCFI